MALKPDNIAAGATEFKNFKNFWFNEARDQSVVGASGIVDGITWLSDAVSVGRIDELEKSHGELEKSNGELEKSQGEPEKSHGELKRDVDELNERLRLSDEDLAMLKLRQLVISVQRELYRTFFPTAPATRNYNVSDLRDRLRREDARMGTNRLAKLDLLLERVGFVTIDETAISEFLRQTEGNTVAHPSVEEKVDEVELQQLLDLLWERCKLVPDDRTNVIRWWHIYSRTREERQQRATNYQ
jgi:hypothetical protein